MPKNRQILIDEEYLVSREEFFKAFEQVSAIFVAMKEAINKQMESMGAEHQKMMSEMVSMMNETTSKVAEMLKTENEKDVSSMKKEMTKMMTDCMDMMSKMESKMEEVKDGKDADEERMIEELTSKIPKAEEILDKVEKDLPKLGEPIRDSLELIEDEDKKLKIEAIGYLRKELDELKRMASKITLGGGGVSSISSHLDLYDLSSQTNGVLFTFSVPGMAKPYMLLSSDFPTPLFLNNGFTYSATNNTITLTTDNAPSSGSQLGLFYSF